MNIAQAAAVAGVSARTLHYYEAVGLITPVRNAENGYRIYSEETVRRARLIHAYRELQFSLREIKTLLDAPRMERDAALERQIRRMEQQRQIIDNRIALAQSMRMLGPQRLTEIDFAQVDAQMEEARRFLEQDAEMQKLSERLKKYSNETGERIAQELTGHIARVANAPTDEIPSAIESLRKFIKTHFGICTDTILTAYARAYGGDGILAQALEDAAGPEAVERLRQRLLSPNT